jgi:hypothetical protein
MASDMEVEIPFMFLAFEGYQRGLLEIPSVFDLSRRDIHLLSSMDNIPVTSTLCINTRIACGYVHREIYPDAVCSADRCISNHEWNS